MDEVNSIVKPPLTDREVRVVRVALPKILRHTNKPAPPLKYGLIGKQYIQSLASKKDKDVGYKKLGDEGWMLETDWENKDFGRYGLTEYFSGAGKANLSSGLAAENSALQDQLMAKDKEMEDLKRLLAEKVQKLEPKETKESIKAPKADK